MYLGKGVIRLHLSRRQPVKVALEKKGDSWCYSNFIFSNNHHCSRSVGVCLALLNSRNFTLGEKINDLWFTPSEAPAASVWWLLVRQCSTYGPYIVTFPDWSGYGNGFDCSDFKEIYGAFNCFENLFRWGFVGVTTRNTNLSSLRSSYVENRFYCDPFSWIHQGEQAFVYPISILK